MEKSLGLNKAIVIGTSAGGIHALNQILPRLPENFPYPLICVVHIPPGENSYLSDVYGPKIKLTAKEADEKETIVAGKVYFAPPDYHLLVEEDETFSLSTEGPVQYSKPSIDVLFESAADCYRERLTAILLTGANEDGARGMKRVKELGGNVVIQDPEEAESSVMPRAAIKATGSKRILSLNEITAYLLTECGGQ